MHRTFNGSDGRMWDVWEVTPADLDHGRGETAPLYGKWSQGWLAFSTQDEKRRLTPAPADWTELSPGQLQVLCERAESVPR
jgi:hypothetical protein